MKELKRRWASESTKFGKFLATVPPFLILTSATCYETMTRMSTLIDPNLIPDEVKVGLALVSGFCYLVGKLTEKKNENS